MDISRRSLLLGGAAAMVAAPAALQMYSDSLALMSYPPLAPLAASFAQTKMVVAANVMRDTLMPGIRQWHASQAFIERINSCFPDAV